MKVLTILSALILSGVALAEGGPADRTYSGQDNYTSRNCSYKPEWCERDRGGEVCYGGYMECRNYKKSNLDWVDEEA